MHRNALLEIVGDIDLYKLLQVVAYIQRESAFTVDRMGTDEILSRKGTLRVLWELIARPTIRSSA